MNPNGQGRTWLSCGCGTFRITIGGWPCPRTSLDFLCGARCGLPPWRAVHTRRKVGGLPETLFDTRAIGGRILVGGLSLGSVRQGVGVFHSSAHGLN